MRQIHKRFTAQLVNVMLRDRLAKQDIKIALSIIIGRAKELGYYQPHPRNKVHDGEVVTTAIGALIQHDASESFFIA